MPLTSLIIWTSHLIFLDLNFLFCMMIRLKQPLISLLGFGILSLNKYWTKVDFNLMFSQDNQYLIFPLHSVVTHNSWHKNKLLHSRRIYIKLWKTNNLHFHAFCPSFQLSFLLEFHQSVISGFSDTDISNQPN